MSLEHLHFCCESDPTYKPEWHWITDQIALGSYPLEPAMKEIQDAGIDAIVCVMEQGPYYDTSGFEEAHAIEQHDLVRYDLQQLIKGLQFFHRQLEAGRKVYVHCFAGISRSSFFVSSYLMLRDNIPFEEAVSRVKSIRSVCSPNPNLYDDKLLRDLRDSRNLILQPSDG